MLLRDYCAMKGLYANAMKGLYANDMKGLYMLTST